MGGWPPDPALPDPCAAEPLVSLGQRLGHGVEAELELRGR